MKVNKKMIIAVSVVLIGAVSLLKMQSVNAATASNSVSHTVIYKRDLVNSISTKGIVEPTNEAKVYSYLNLKVKELKVETGDEVKAGDILLVLDTEELELTIAQQKAELSVAELTSLNQLNNNRRLLNEASSNLNNNNNAQILNATQAFAQAEASLTNAQKAYNELLEDSTANTSSQIVQAESNLKNAQIDFDLKKTNYENAQALYAADGISFTEFDQIEKAYTNAETKLKDAEISLENAGKSENRSLESAKINLETAQNNYNTTKASLDAAKKSASQEIDRYANSVAGSEISANMDAKLIAIQKLELNLENAQITAPISGTVTAVYANEGAVASGLLVVIEDTKDLKITTKIKEYDIAKVKNEMPVIIKTDATGDTAYDGTITKINSAALKNAAGDIVFSDDVEFESEVKVNEKDTALKIGMNARLTIILEEKNGIYAVTYDAIKIDKDGSPCVFTIINGTGGKPEAKKIPVSLGMETDFYVEIISNDLSEGMSIVDDASSVEDGMRITVK